MAYIYIFSAIAVFILLIACINFMNLATARSIDRSREVGIRKVVGALRTQLTRQFLSESIILSVISTALALVLAKLLLPYFNNLTAKSLGFHLINQQPYLFLLAGFPIVVGLVAGSYPALFLSAFKPVETIKGKLKASSKGVLLRKGLVVFQFAISVMLIIGTALVFKQLSFMRSQDLGYRQDQIVVLPLRGDRGARQKYESLRNLLRQRSSILKTSISSGIPGRGYNNSVFRIEGNISNIVGILSIDFIKLVVLANLLAWPVAYFAMNRWLDAFAFRTDMGWVLFPTAASVALLIAFLTVAFQAVKAAVSNPVDTLRYE